MKDYYQQRITSEHKAKAFFEKLYLDGKLFHPEDDPRDIVNLVEDEDGLSVRDGIEITTNTFTEEEAVFIEKRLNEAYKYIDPCEYIMENIYTPQKLTFFEIKIGNGWTFHEGPLIDLFNLITVEDIEYVEFTYDGATYKIKPKSYE